MSPGDKIYYQYTHHLNSRSVTEITKEGIFIRWVKTGSPRKNSQTAIVHLNGNKLQSKIHRSNFKSEEEYLQYINNK